MTRRVRHGAVLGVMWLLSLALLALIVVMYVFTPTGARFSRGYGFPHMPMYGAVTWWFFFTIPLIGWTWGFFNDLKDPGLKGPGPKDQHARRPERA